MSRTLDIDRDIKIWLPTLDDVKAGRIPTCPRCGSKNTEVVKKEYEDGIGFALITCNDCGKSGHFSRISFR